MYAATSFGLLLDTVSLFLLVDLTLELAVNAAHFLLTFIFQAILEHSSKMVE